MSDFSNMSTVHKYEKAICIIYKVEFYADPKKIYSKPPKNAGIRIW